MVTLDEEVTVCSLQEKMVWVKNAPLGKNMRGNGIRMERKHLIQNKGSIRHFGHKVISNGDFVPLETHVLHH